ncbi:DNA internalization-related competence protein ComEC/Rec2 [Paenisporosarcina cavernae]|uniref:DNA internalization-related competence protein ComEC/Rec2 n=1 Tax=Paenisporosarcina cavernae TaxID=2320858 RepID=A0A385YT17_9BACL|nr:DNA internalization-related competence protein ComEC/Rec2 [Paenisporosarcina cavernae]AYC29684.1 DNA internalization-related competence protein ComEC/Rec2 [Paenisporosarcina cavernae]
MSHWLLFVAVGACISAATLVLSPFFLLAHLFLVVIFWKRRYSVAATILYLVISCTILVRVHYVQPNSNKVFHNGVMEWTDTYKINGNTLSGVILDNSGTRWQATYQIPKEVDKIRFENEPLVGVLVQIEAIQVIPKQRVHRYAYDEKAYFAQESITGKISIETMYEVGYSNTFLNKWSTYRFTVGKHIDRTFPSPWNEEAKALLIGWKSSMDDKDRATYQTLGLSHLFAISGLHVSLLAWGLYGMLIRFGIRKRKALYTLLVCLPLYALLAGGSSSVWRSVLMAGAAIMFILKKKRNAISIAFSLSMIVLLFVKPAFILSVGFQLSYLATFALIYSQTFFSRLTSFWQTSLMITFLSQLMTLPVLLFHFFQVSISSFLMNILFVPLFTLVILPLNLLFFVLSYLPSGIFVGIMKVYSPIRQIIQECMYFAASIPYQTWNPGKPSLIWIVILYICILYALAVMERQESIRKILAILLIPLILFHLSPLVNRSIEVTFLDVGQGDSIFIQLPHGRKAILIDTGGFSSYTSNESWKQKDQTFAIGKDVVAKYLQGKGISKVEKVIATHADADHIEGLDDFLQLIDSKELVISPGTQNEPEMKKAIEISNKRKIPVREKYAGEGFALQGVQFRYLSPFEGNYEGNDDSLVVLMEGFQRKVLFTGDLEERGEKKLIEHTLLSHVDILKVGHHGSKTSSSKKFMETISPTYSIISVSATNRYGHPHPLVLAQLEAVGSEILLTKDIGSITFFIHPSGRLERMNE